MNAGKQRRSEDGVALIMVILLVAVIAILTTALVDGEAVTFRQTSSIRKVDLRETGANSGLEWAVQAIKSGSSAYCQSSGLWTKDLTIGGRTVRVVCKMAAGSTPSGPGGLALYGTGGVIDIGGPLGATVNGPVYNAGTYALGTLAVSGQVSEPDPAPLPISGACSTSRPGPVGLTSYFMVPPPVPLPVPPPPPISLISQCTIPLSYMATPLAAATEPADSLTAWPAGPKQITDDSGQPCGVFLPGKYRRPPELLANNYFQPGVYYFEWGPGFGAWNISSSIWAGDPIPPTPASSGDNVLSTIRRCKKTTGAMADQDLVRPPTAEPFGVQFIFGDQARFAVRNQGRLEMFSFQVTSGTPPKKAIRPNVRAVVRGAEAASFGPPLTPPVITPDPWGKSSSLPANTPLFSVGNGAKAELIIHGGVYAPANSVKMRGTNTSIAKISGTTVVHSLETFAPTSFTDNAFVDVLSGSGSREFLLLARSERIDAEPPLCSSAMITVYNNGSISPPAPRSHNLNAWRVDRQPGTGITESLGPDGANCVLPFP